MTIFQAIILGIIQGLSEFIPISSTAHLTLAGKLMGVIDPANPEAWTSFIAVIQMGTLLAVFMYFSKEIRSIPAAFIKENLARTPFVRQSDDSRTGWFIIAGSLPIIVIGLAFKDVIRSNFTKDPFVIGSALIGLALILLLAEKTGGRKKAIRQLSFKDAMIIGTAQVFSLIPGSSRSGTTITGGLFAGLDREAATRYSFLLGIPAIFGSGVLEFIKTLDTLNAADTANLIAATTAAMISGYFSIAFLIRFLKKHSTILFINYRIILGIIVIIMAWKGFL